MRNLEQRSLPNKQNFASMKVIHNKPAEEKLGLPDPNKFPLMSSHYRKIAEEMNKKGIKPTSYCRGCCGPIYGTSDEGYHPTIHVPKIENGSKKKKMVDVGCRMLYLQFD